MLYRVPSKNWLVSTLKRRVKSALKCKTITVDDDGVDRNSKDGVQNSAFLCSLPLTSFPVADV